jgi:hypothetical protein
MSNLSELLPSGGGQNAVDFVASGTLGNGQTVALKTDGTVEAVGGASSGVGSQTAFDSSRIQGTAAAYDANSGKIVIWYVDYTNTNRPTGVVGTVSGTSISFGTATTANTDQATGAMQIVYDSTNQKVVCTYRETATGGDVVYAVVGTVSGTSISFGSKVDAKARIAAGTTHITDMTYDATAQRVVFVYKDGAIDNYGSCHIGTVSGTSTTWGARVVFKSSTVNYPCVAYSPDAGKVVIGYDNNNNDVLAVVGTPSGSSISFGSESTVTTDNGSYMRIAYDTSSDKFVIAYLFNTSNGYAAVGTVSGTSVTWGTPVVFAAGEYYGTEARAVYNALANKVVFVWKNANVSDTGTFVEGSVSGTSISFSSSTTFGTNTTFLGAAYDSVNGKVVFSMSKNTNSGVGQVVTNAFTNSADFIGITAEAISDTATGSVNTFGGINEAQSSLTIGSDYYVQDDGSIATTSSDVKIGKAISATTINMMDLT